MVALLLESYHLKHRDLDGRVVERCNSFEVEVVEEEHSFGKGDAEVEGLCANSCIRYTFTKLKNLMSHL